MTIAAHSPEEIEYLNELNTVTFIICKTTNNKYYIIVGESVSKFGPCYLNKKCEIVTHFDRSEYISSYSACIEIIEQVYSISNETKTPYYYTSIEAKE